MISPLSSSISIRFSAPWAEPRKPDAGGFSGRTINFVRIQPLMKSGMSEDRKLIRRITAGNIPLRILLGEVLRESRSLAAPPARSAVFPSFGDRRWREHGGMRLNVFNVKCGMGAMRWIIVRNLKSSHHYGLAQAPLRPAAVITWPPFAVAPRCRRPPRLDANGCPGRFASAAAN
jgi:hypothetical protein